MHGKQQVTFLELLKDRITIYGVSATKAAYLANGMEEWEFNWMLAQLMGQIGTLARWKIVKD